MKRALFLLLICQLVIFCWSNDFYVARSENLVFYFPSSVKDDIADYLDISEEIFREKAVFFNQEKTSPVIVYIDDAIDSRRGEADPFKVNINMNFFFDPKQFTSFETLFAHEMIHILNFRSARKGLSAFDYYLKLGFIPLWVYEGFSEYFSRGDDPFFLYESKKFPFYTSNEMNIFYSRDPYDRAGGYSQSYHMLRSLYKKYDKRLLSLWQDISRSGNIKRYMKENLEPFSSFFEDFKKDLFKPPIKDKDINIITSGIDISGFRIKTGKSYYLDYYDNNRSKKALYKGNKRREFVVKDLHSFCIDDKGVIYFSRLVKKTGNIARYHIFKHVKNKTIKTNMRGIYPDIEGNLLTTSDGHGNILLYDINRPDRPIKRFKGFFSKIKDKTLYFFNTSESYLSRFFIDNDKVPTRLITYDKTGFDIIFIAGKPYIDIYENGKFFLKSENADEKIEYPGGNDIFYHNQRLYFRMLSPGSSSVVCK